MDGSERLFQDMNWTLLPVIRLVLIFSMDKSVSQGCWKLYHMIVAVVFCCKTRFPEYKSWAVELGREVVTLADQITSFCPFSSNRSPSTDIVRTPEESWFVSVSNPYDSEHENVVIPYSKGATGRVYWAEQSQFETTPIGNYIIRVFDGLRRCDSVCGRSRRTRF